MSISTYLHALSGRIFKILPMKEQAVAGEDVHLDLYLGTLAREMQGACVTFYQLGDCAEYISLINTVNGLGVGDDLQSVKRETFKMMRTLDRVKELFGDADG